ncbi:MAG: hypothetical protein COA94_01115 [Rickettsiales bacterium]|nr:MAG: hypothetical protein COA94_01115 [Rickettsiales bacterium]
MITTPSKPADIKQLNTAIDQLNEFLLSKDYITLLQQQYLSPETVAKIMEVKTSLLSNWRVTGGGPSYIKLGSGSRGLVRYPLLGQAGLIHYMQQKLQNSSSDDKI